MEVSGHRKIRRIKLRWKEIIQKRYEGDNTSTERRSTRLKNVDNTNLMRRPQRGKAEEEVAILRLSSLIVQTSSESYRGSKTNNSANYYH